MVRSHGGLTAWTDKHPSYEWTNGPSGRGVEDFYGPEINSKPVPLANIPGCQVAPFVDDTPDDGWTNSFDDIKCYDSLSVQAALNQIDGYNHDRTRRVGVPALFGTNFQAVRVGHKLAVTGAKGGYLDAMELAAEPAGAWDSGGLLRGGAAQQVQRPDCRSVHPGHHPQDQHRHDFHRWAQALRAWRIQRG